MNCREQTPEGTWVYLDPQACHFARSLPSSFFLLLMRLAAFQEQVELTGSRGVANLVIKVWLSALFLSVRACECSIVLACDHCLLSFICDAVQGLSEGELHPNS